MRGMGLSRLVITLGLILLAGQALAAEININITVDLEESQIYDCGGGAYPRGTMCWTNLWDQSSFIASQTVNPSEDTVVIRLDFADSMRIRWETDGVSAPTYGDESVQAGAWGQGNCCSGVTFENSLSFLAASGDLNYNPIEWLVTASTGGIVSHSFLSGLTNLTDSAFEFDGIVSTIGPYENYSDGPYIVERAAVFFTSGNFSYVSAVPLPAAAWLFLSAIGGLVLIKCKRS